MAESCYGKILLWPNPTMANPAMAPRSQSVGTGSRPPFFCSNRSRFACVFRNFSSMRAGDFELTTHFRLISSDFRIAWIPLTSSGIAWIPGISRVPRRITRKMHRPSRQFAEHTCAQETRCADGQDSRGSANPTMADPMRSDVNCPNVPMSDLAPLLTSLGTHLAAALDCL